MRLVQISIHAPLTGGDSHSLNQASTVMISIHAPLTGGDNQNHGDQNRNHEFQSTPPSRGATISVGFAVRSPGISIHAPLTGGDFPLLSVMVLK